MVVVVVVTAVVVEGAMMKMLMDFAFLVCAISNEVCVGW